MKKTAVLFLLLCAALAGCNKPMAPSQPYSSAVPAATETPGMQSWEEIKAPDFYEPRAGHAAVYFQNKYFIFGGAGGEKILDSTLAYDGLKWITPAAESLPDALEYAAAGVFGGKIIVTGGKGAKGAVQAVYSSDEGNKWEKKDTRDFGAVYGHAMTAFKGRLRILGGLDSEGVFRADSYSSKDGEKFEKVKIPEGAEPFGRRAFFTAATFKGSLVACAGRTPSGLSASVIFSDDGADWETATENAAFGPREKHAMAVYKGRLWVSGGINAKNETLDDLWWSEDGAVWVSVTAKESYGARHSHSMAEVRSMLFMTGGENKGKKINDTRRAK